MTKPWTKRLFLPAENPSSFGDIVAWWELRRIAFNALEHFPYSCEPDDACECRFSWGKTAYRLELSVYTYRENALVGALGAVSFSVNLWLWTTYIQKPGEDDGFGPLVPVIVFAFSPTSSTPAAGL